MRVLGIDPGTANTGYGVVVSVPGRLTALTSGVIETSPRAPLERRLADIHGRVAALIDEHEPDAVAVEDLFFGTNARSAFAVGQARGVVLLAAGQRAIPCATYGVGI
jgi:crossover junction endodeoxyribonuclease RuvC